MSTDLIRELKLSLVSRHYSTGNMFAAPSLSMQGLVSNKYFRYSALGDKKDLIHEEFSLIHLEALKTHLKSNKYFATINILGQLKRQNKQPVFQKKSPEGWYDSSLWKFDYTFAGRVHTLAIKEMVIRDAKYFHHVMSYSNKLGDNYLSENLPGYLSQHIDHENQVVTEVTEWHSGQTLDSFLKKCNPLGDSFHLQRIVAQLYSALDTLQAKQLMHRDIWEKNIIYNSSSGKLVIIDTSTACSVEDQKSPNCYVGYGNLRYLDDKMSIRRLENKIYKIYSNSYNTHIKSREYSIQSEYSQSLFERLESLHIPPEYKETIVLSGSSVLAILGLRANRDIDMLHPFYMHAKNLSKEIASHNFQIRYLSLKGFWDIYMDPSCVFNWRGYKVLSPYLLLRLKKNRLKIEKRGKDLQDIKLLTDYLDSAQP